MAGKAFGLVRRIVPFIMIKTIILVYSLAVVVDSAEAYYHVVDHTASDQGKATFEGSRSVKDFIVNFGDSKKGTIIFSRSNSGNTTKYIFSTSIAIPANIHLVFEQGAVIVANPGAKLTIHSPDIIHARDRQKIFSDGNAGHDGVAFNKSGKISVGWWGVEDGKSITPALQKAFWAFNNAGGGSLVFPPGKYTFNDWTNGNSKNTKINNCAGVLITGYGATITYTAGEGARSAFLEIQDSINVKIAGLYVDGNTEKNEPHTGGAILLHIVDAHYITIENCSFINAQNDGLLTYHRKNESMYGVIKSSKFAGNSRNNISMTHCIGWTIQGCYIADAGQSKNRSPSGPWYGIDFEPGHSKEVVGITVLNCEIKNNRAGGIGHINGSGICRNITIDSCKITPDLDNRKSYAIRTGSRAQNFVVRNCEILGGSSVSGQVRFENNRFINDNRVKKRHRCIIFEATATTGCTLNGNNFEISGSYAKSFIVCANRRGNSEAWYLPIRDNEFLVKGKGVISPDVITSATPRKGDIILWEGNTFTHVGKAPVMPYYANFKTSDRLLDANMFDENFRKGGKAAPKK